MNSYGNSKPKAALLISSKRTEVNIENLEEVQLEMVDGTTIIIWVLLFEKVPIE